MIKIKCNTCGTDLIIVDNILLFEGEKSTEIANCTICNSEVYKGETDGWYFVEIINEQLFQTLPPCIYPMP